MYTIHIREKKGDWRTRGLDVLHELEGNGELLQVQQPYHVGGGGGGEPLLRGAQQRGGRRESLLSIISNKGGRTVAVHVGEGPEAAQDLLVHARVDQGLLGGRAWWLYVGMWCVVVSG